MDRKQQLAALLEQAAARVTMLDAKDSADIQAFEGVLGQLNTLAADAADADAALKAFHQVSQNAAQWAEQLQTASNETADAQIESLASAVTEMQRLLDEVASPKPQPPAQTAVSAAFSEDDIPLIQDFIAESREHIESAEIGRAHV